MRKLVVGNVLGVQLPCLKVGANGDNEPILRAQRVERDRAVGARTGSSTFLRSGEAG